MVLHAEAQHDVDIFRVFKVIESNMPGDYVQMSQVRDELVHARRLLVLCYSDTARHVLPYSFAQDAEGASANPDAQYFGGWGLGVGFPPAAETVNLALLLLSKTVPNDSTQVARRRTLGGHSVLSDECVPAHWTGGIHWHALLARAHSYREAVHLYEGRVLLRSAEISAKLAEARRSSIVCLEDNQVVVHSFNHGRSSVYSLNQLCRRRCALELSADQTILPVWVQTSRMPMDALSRDRVIIDAHF